MNNFTKYVKVNYKKIRDLRIKNNITQKQMADFFNINFSTYSLKENGKRQFTVQELKALAGIFKVKMDDLIEVDL